METLLPLGLLVLIVAALLRMLFPAPLPPRVIYIQTVAEPEPQPRQGCLGIALALAFLLLLASLLFASA